MIQDHEPRIVSGIRGQPFTRRFESQAEQDQWILKEGVYFIRITETRRAEGPATFILDHYNFGLRRVVATLEEAQLLCIRSGFDATVFRNSGSSDTPISGSIVARYNSIGGWSLV